MFALTPWTRYEGGKFILQNGPEIFEKDGKFMFGKLMKREVLEKKLQKKVQKGAKTKTNMIKKVKLIFAIFIPQTPNITFALIIREEESTVLKQVVTYPGLFRDQG